MRVWLPTVRAGSGADAFALRLTEALRRRGIDAVLAWFPHWTEVVPQIVRVHSEARNVAERFDIIHANSWTAYAFLGLGLPVVTTVHHLVHDPFFAPYRSKAQAIYHRWCIYRRERFAVQASAAVTTVSNYVARTVEDEFGRHDLYVIPNWVDTDRYRPASRSRRAGRHRVLWVGNHSRRKGADLLPSLLKALGPSFEVRCTGGLRGGSTDLSKVSHNSASVSILGRLPEEILIREYQECDVVVSLSRYEGFGYTALEAMACGKPFVGFSTSGLTEVVRDGSTGWLVPLDDVLCLAARCKEIADNPDLGNRMGEEGRALAVSAFSRDALISRYIELYESVSTNSCSLRKDARALPL